MSPLVAFPALFLLFGLIQAALLVATGGHDLATLLVASQLLGSPVVYLATAVGFLIGLDLLLTKGVMIAVIIAHYALLGLACGHYFRTRTFSGFREYMKAAVKAFFITWAMLLPMAAGFTLALVLLGP